MHVNVLVISGLSEGQGKNVREDFNAFFEAHKRMVAKTVYGIVQDAETAKDLTQEAFALCYSKWARVSRYDVPEAWVRRVAIRLATKNVRRDAMRHRLQLSSFTPVSEPAPRDPDVAAALRRLSGAQRAAVVLTYYGGHTAPEIAETLGCSEATVRVHLHRARKNLRLALGDDDV